MSWELTAAFAGSFVAGYVGSMLGLVLGTLRLPLIVALTGSPLAAAGTNIAISAAAAGAGAVRHAREGRVDWRVVAWMAPPSIVGRDRGRAVADDVSERALYAAIAAVLVWSGIDLAFRPVRRARPRAAAARAPAVLGGFGIGALGGAVGVILGTLRMPALVRGVGLDVRRAAGTNLVVGFLLGVAGFAAHAGSLGVDWATLAAGLAGAIPGGWLGRAGDGPRRRERAADRARRRARARGRRVRGPGGLLARQPDRRAGLALVGRVDRPQRRARTAPAVEPRRARRRRPRACSVPATRAWPRRRRRRIRFSPTPLDTQAAPAPSAMLHGSPPMSIVVAAPVRGSRRVMVLSQ